MVEGGVPVLHGLENPKLSGLRLFELRAFEHGQQHPSKCHTSLKFEDTPGSPYNAKWKYHGVHVVSRLLPCRQVHRQHRPRPSLQDGHITAFIVAAIELKLRKLQV